jgi:hypothetical protein
MAGAAQTGGEAKKDPESQDSGGIRILLVACVGGLLTAAAVIGMLKNASIPGGGSELSFVPRDQIVAAAATLTPDARPDLVEQADKCVIPIAYVSVVSTGGEETVRIRSGNYVSPQLTITQTPQRIAIPWPAPYQTGRGQISIEGDTKGALVSLYPTWRIDSSGLVENVWWVPEKHC